MQLMMLGPEMAWSHIGEIDHHRLIHTGVAGIITASLSDRIGRRPVLLTCTTLLMIGSFLCGCATRYWAQKWAVWLAEEQTEVVRQTCCIIASSKVKVRKRTANNGNNVCFQICLFSSDCLECVILYIYIYTTNRSSTLFFGAHTTKELRTSLQRECFKAWVRRWSRSSLPWPERLTCNWSWNSSGGQRTR